MPEFSESSGGCEKGAIHDILNLSHAPLVGCMMSLQEELLIVVGKSFSQCGSSGSGNSFDFTRRTQRYGIHRFSDEATHKGELFVGSEIAQNFIAFARNVDWHLIGHHRGRRAGPRRESEDVKISEREFCDEAARGLEFCVRLAGKSNHYIRANSGGGYGLANFFDLLAIVPWSIFAVHAPQHRIAARLQRNVRVPGN